MPDKIEIPNEFDLNKPPKEPYKFQAFPKVVYDLKRSAPSKIVEIHKEDGRVIENHIPPKIVSKIVQNEDELKASLASGWSEKAPKQHPDADPDPDAEPKPKNSSK